MAPKLNQFRSLIDASGQGPMAVPIDSISGSGTASRKRVGKRSSAEYAQIGLYLPKKLHNEAKIRLIQEGNSRDFSQLIEDLLLAYTNTQLFGSGG